MHADRKVQIETSSSATTGRSRCQLVGGGELNIGMVALRSRVDRTVRELTWAARPLAPAAPQSLASGPEVGIGGELGMGSVELVESPTALWPSRPGPSPEQTLRTGPEQPALV